VTQRKRLGLIVNPLAGIGGRVGLKGSDGPEIVRRALELGAVREAPHRAQLALARLTSLRDSLEVITCPGEMGESEARAVGLLPTVLDLPLRAEQQDVPSSLPDGTPLTTAADTVNAARALADRNVDLLLFAGGDGTARNVFDAVGDRLLVVGIPAGVKIHSAVYATTPIAAGDLAALVLGPQGAGIRERQGEVMDIDEDAFRDNRVSARLYGYLRVPYQRTLLQSAKAGSQTADEAALNGIANEVVNDMESGVTYFIGPGTTTRAILDLLALPDTLLGVDVVRDRKLLAADASELDLLRLLEQPGTRAKIIVTAIGGQGHIFGRGNQQFSPRIIRQVGRDNILVIATQSKLLSLEGKPLLVDTGDPDLDRELAGYVKVITGLHERLVYPVRGDTG